MFIAVSWGEAIRTPIMPLTAAALVLLEAATETYLAHVESKDASLGNHVIVHTPLCIAPHAHMCRETATGPDQCKQRLVATPLCGPRRADLRCRDVADVRDGQLSQRLLEIP